AHPPLIDVRVFTRLQAINAILILFDLDRAARGAIGAYSAVAAHKPDALFVKKILVAQRADGAQIDDVARELVDQRKFDLAGVIAEHVDLFVSTAVDHHQLAGAADLARET